MDAFALRLRKTDGWTYLGGQPQARKEPEVVVRAMEGDVRFAVGQGERGPDGEGLLVRQGEGRRLAGRHFFVRPAASAPCLLVHRGLV